MFFVVRVLVIFVRQHWCGARRMPSGGHANIKKQQLLDVLELAVLSSMTDHHQYCCRSNRSISCHGEEYYCSKEIITNTRDSNHYKTTRFSKQHEVQILRSHC